MRRARFCLLRSGLACPTPLANVLLGVRLLGGLSDKGVCAREAEVSSFPTFAVVRITRRLASVDASIGEAHTVAKAQPRPPTNNPTGVKG